METTPLTPTQRRILSYLFEHWRSQGRPPSLRQVCQRFGFKAVGSAQDHIAALQRKGYLRATRRGIQLIQAKVWQLFGIPIIGSVPAGAPRLADAEFLGTLTPEDFYPVESGLFALKVQGDSMKDAGILSGDLVIVREQPTADLGEIVVALIHEEATVKRLIKRGSKFYLEPANPDYTSAPLNGGKVLGKVIQVLRKLG